ncbi:Putative Flp pilus-assembly TadE/G-like [Actinacidiphila paucisporea]|uniref:Putative Flp pilus-assembly TadE/G-like n=1 Tax=Actinacidiphila paucisporea TaxID=310782 RepID=A0A1M6UHU9_9ACTN|nr:Putative Flp pilus-assembly TadE/G-like [Actinacidiphila paucisporea]
MSALFFLAFAFFAVGQASVAHNSAQSAADAAALAAARQSRDEAHDALLAALKAGDLGKLGDLARLLQGVDEVTPCIKAGEFANDNGAQAKRCTSNGGPGSYTVDVESLTGIGRTVVRGADGIKATAHATAEVTSRCDSHPPQNDGGKLTFVCDGKSIIVDPASGGFTLDLSMFYAVHLTS